jgi:hypothetical protein
MIGPGNPVDGGATKRNNLVLESGAGWLAAPHPTRHILSEEAK